ncbi:hypothetical protein [Arthrobacter sp. HLT1-21]
MLPEPGARPARPRKRRESTIEDVEFLVASDVPEDLIAERIGYSSAKNLKTAIHRWGRHDLVARVTASGQPLPSIRRGRVVLRAVA